MFETAELGRKVSKTKFKQKAMKLRESLLVAQGKLREAPFPVIVLFAGVDGAGKGETVNLLNEWMDPRWIHTRSFGSRTKQERKQPRFWRYWRDLPPKGHIGILLSAWYSEPVLERVYGETDGDGFDERLDEIVAANLE